MSDKVLNKTIGAYEYGYHMQKILKKYMDKKMTFSEFPDMNTTNELISEEKELCRKYCIRDGREKVLSILMLAESDWLRHHNEYESNQVQLHIIYNIINEHRKMLAKEWKRMYAIFKILQDNPIPKGCDTEKAIRYNIKLMKNRISGKTSPIDIMIADDVKKTPFLGYSSYLVRQNKSIWEYAKELFPNFRLLNDDTFEYEKTEIPKEEFIIKFHPLIEYVYTNNKLNFINFRNKIWDASKDAMDDRKKKKEEEKEKKRKELISKCLDDAIKSHNKWYYAGHDELQRRLFPRKFDKFVKERDELGHEFIIVAVSKRSSGGYKYGYLNKDFIGYSLESPYTYKTMDEAKRAIDEFKSNGTILDGTYLTI